MEHKKHKHTEACGCGHDHGQDHHHHEETCECGHDHGQEHHHHEETCRCGHDHGQEHHHHEEACECGHDHGHGHHHSDTKQTIFTMENLGCAHCAAKMEDKIRTLDGVEDVSITFATKQMRVAARNAVALLPAMQEICTKIEPDVKLVPPTKEKVESAPAKKSMNPLIPIVIGAVLFGTALIYGHLTHNEQGIVPIMLFLIAYVLLGGHVLLNASKNLMRGQMLDENFLMSIATIGAIILGEYSEAVGVMLFYRIGEYCEERAVSRSRQQITEAIDLRPDVVTVLDAKGKANEVPAEEVQVGETIQVLVGDRIPLDGVILTGESRLDTAAITGEPVPVLVGAGSEIHSGCINLSGVLIMRVTRVLEESMVSRILHAVEDAAATKPKIERVLTRFAHVYTPTVVVIAALTALIPSFITGNWEHWVHTALTFLVISCPCALVLSVPLAFFSGIGAGSKKGILFKSGASLEALHDIKCVAMDKTGTLTLGNFVVQEVSPANGLDADTLLALTASCESHSTHPIAISIVASAKQKNLKLHDPSALQEKSGMGLIATLHGKTILCGNEKLMIDQKVAMGKQEAVTGSVVYVAIDGVYAGKIHVADTIKSEAVSTIKTLQKRGLKTAMLTGDNKRTAELTAKELGLDDVRGDLLPTDKVAGLLDLREKHGAILYIGDGINDAPVLAGADVGGAMGSGADAAIEIADIVFMTSDLSTIDQAVDIAHRTHTIVHVNIWLALSAKILVMLLGITGIYSSMWLAIFADVGVALICVLNAVQTLYRKR